MTALPTVLLNAWQKMLSGSKMTRGISISMRIEVAAKCSKEIVSMISFMPEN
jgi:hypothetical protein